MAKSKLKKSAEVFVLAVGVVFVWRGVWGLADIYLFPNNEVLSFSLSIVIGVIILYLHGKNLEELN